MCQNGRDFWADKSLGTRFQFLGSFFEKNRPKTKGTRFFQKNLKARIFLKKDNKKKVRFIV
jgi:hypothetical protein